MTTKLVKCVPGFQGCIGTLTFLLIHILQEHVDLVKSTYLSVHIMYGQDKCVYYQINSSSVFSWQRSQEPSSMNNTGWTANRWG